MTRKMIFTLSIMYFVLGLTGPAIAQTCRDNIKQAQTYFSDYHIQPTHLDLAAQTYLKAAADPLCAYDAYFRLADLEICRGTIQKKKADKVRYFEASLAYAEKAVAANPKGKEGHYQVAVALGSIVQIDGVMKNIFKVRKIKKENDTALAIDPNFAQALVIEANFNSDMPGIFGGDDKKAEALFRKALESDPRYETAYIELAEFLFERKRFPEAKTLLDKVLSPSFTHVSPAAWETVEKPRAMKLAAGVATVTK